MPAVAPADAAPQVSGTQEDAPVHAPAAVRKGSIAASLFWLSAGWLVLALVATGFLLTDLYSRALDTSLSDTLNFHVESLAGAVLETGDPSSLDIALSDPRFDRPRSGWYWAIRGNDGTLHNLSNSVVGIALPDLTGPMQAGRRTAILDDAFGTRMRVVERTVTLAPNTYQIVVTGNLSEILLLVDNFRGQAFIVLGAVGVMLAIMSAIVARFAMRPIDRLSAAIERVREGESVAVTGTYPREIAPLAEEVNELLRSNTQIIERARNQVGNLAHGLKTPIAVLRNEAAARKGPLATAGLLVLTQLFTLYLSYVARTFSSYGAVGAFFLLMIWVNFSVSIVLVGTVLNATISECYHGPAQEVRSRVDNALDKLLAKVRDWWESKRKAPPAKSDDIVPEDGAPPEDNATQDTEAPQETATGDNRENGPEDGHT